MPVRYEETDPGQLSVLAKLDVVSETGKSGADDTVKSEIPESVGTRKYMEKMSQVRALRDSMTVYTDAMEKYREKYAMSDVEKE